MTSSKWYQACFRMFYRTLVISFLFLIYDPKAAGWGLPLAVIVGISSEIEIFINKKP